MIHRPTSLCYLSVWLLMVVAPALLLSQCRDGDPTTNGVHWQPPADEELPMAFDAAARALPPYARAWHMPPGFPGFPARWNERVRKFIERRITQLEEELTHEEGIIGDTEPDARQTTRLLFLREELDRLQSRRAMGDYLVFLTEDELPPDLEWHSGAAQPELGDPRAVKGGTLRLALPRSFPNTLRVFGPNSNNSTRRYIYDDLELPLVRIHPATGALIPGTADRWAVSPGGRTIYFHIDPAARFSNGDPLTTRDFVSSLFLRTSPYSAEPFYADYYMGNIARIAVYSDHVLAVTLPAPKPYAPFYAGSIPSSCTRFFAEFGPDFMIRYQWRPVPTTGGYAINPDLLAMGSSLTLSRVKNWWAAGRRYTRYSCNVDHIRYSFIAEVSKQRELFRIGELDVISARDADYWYEGLEIPPVHLGYIQRVRFDNEWPRNCFGFHLNCSAAPFNDINARLGFHHALNVQAVINTLFRGDFKRGGTYFAGFGAFSDSSIRALPYDPEKARAFFAAAGFTEEGPDGILHKPDGTRLQIVVSSRVDSSYASAMSILREDAARCGLDLVLSQMDDTVFYIRVKNKQYTACLFSWGFSPPVPDASQFFLSRYAFDARGNPLRGTNNITATASPELDRAIHAAGSATTVEQAITAQHTVQRCIADTASWVPGWSSGFWRFAQWRWLRWPKTKDTFFCPPLYFDPLDSHLYWIDPRVKRNTLRARARRESFPEQELDIPLPTHRTATP